MLATGVALVRLLGWSWWIVETPSMGRAAPVGTLVVSEPPGAPLHPGDVITYAPPSGAAGTVTHRVVEVDAAAVRTKGDLNAADDPWPVPMADVRGRAVALLPGAGWAVRVLPLLLGGIAAVLLLTAVIRERAIRGAVRLVGCSAVVCAAVLLFRPLVDAVVTTVSTAHGRVEVQLAGTGLLPVHVSALGRGVDLTSGALGVLRLPPGEQGRIVLTTALHLDPLGWAVFAATCALPLLVTVVRLRRGLR